MTDCLHPAPPIPAAVPKVGKFRSTKLPAVDERTLGNGLRALAVRKPGIPLVQARLVLPAPRPRATDADQAKQLVLAETLLSGTQHRDSVEVAEALQGMGGHAAASSVDSEDLRLQGVGAVPVAGRLPGAHRRAAGRARLPQGGGGDRAGPQGAGGAAATGRAGGHRPGGLHAPRSSATTPTPAASPTRRRWPAVSAADLRRYFTSRVTARDGLLILVGDLRPAKALDAAEAALGSWTGAATVSRLPALPADRVRARSCSSTARARRRATSGSAAPP